MTLCTTNTYNKPNDCPIPTVTPTPSVTPAPTSTPLPQSGDIPAYVAPATPTPAGVLGVSIVPSDTPTPTPDENIIQIPLPQSITITKTVIWQILAVSLSWMILMILAVINRKWTHRKKKQSCNPEDPVLK
jgi:hypothetical protein